MAEPASFSRDEGVEDIDALRHSIEETLHSGDFTSLAEALDQLGAQDLAFVLSHLDREEQEKLIGGLERKDAATLLADLAPVQAVDLLASQDEVKVAGIIEHLPAEQQADLLGDLSDHRREAILGAMAPELAEATRDLLSYPPHTAGGLMTPRCIRVPGDLKVSGVIEHLQRETESGADIDVQYVYVTNEDGVLVGVLPLRSLLFAARHRPASEVMIPRPHSVPVLSSLDELREFFDEHSFIGAPVVDPGGRLLGIVRRASVERAAQERANKLLLRISGIVGGEELRSMPLRVRSGRRISWLSLNIFLNLIGAMVIAAYTGTLEKFIALAVFLPIISDMSGCSGNQAVAVSIREITLGFVRPRDFLRVLFKEAAVGLINGLALGVLLAVVAQAVQHFVLPGPANLLLSVVVGSSLAINTLVSVCFGGLLPLLLKAVRLDPALVSSPMLTTITDMCGFFLVLSLATAVMA